MLKALRIAGLVLASVIAATACTGGGGDDDDIASPSPTPVLEPDGCQIIWLTRTTPGPAGIVDFWLVDAPIAAWTVGTHDYATPGGPTGTWYGDYDLATGSYARRAIATTGSFTLLAAAASNGNFVRFEDQTAQPIFLLDSAGVPAVFQGTGGTGAFLGNLSDPFSANVEPGTGTVALAIDGTARTLGVDLSYAVCYEGAAPPARPIARFALDGAPPRTPLIRARLGAYE